VSVLESLPNRPLGRGELTSLNRADAVDLAVSVESEGEAESLLVATDDWVTGLAYDGEGWRLVERVALDADTERIHGLQACEEAIVEWRDAVAGGADGSVDEDAGGRDDGTAGGTGS